MPVPADNTLDKAALIAAGAPVPTPSTGSLDDINQSLEGFHPYGRLQLAGPPPATEGWTQEGRPDWEGPTREATGFEAFDNPDDARAAYERETGQALPQSAPPAARPSGGGPAPDPYAERLEGDYNERLAAMGDEASARKAESQDVSGAYGRAADEARGDAMASMAQSHANAEAARAKIAEVEQLNQDYANGKIDKDAWWSDKTVPQKIATVIGGMLAGLGGGVQGAMDYYRNLQDRSIAIQKDQLERQYKAGMTATNLLGSFMRTSESEQEAEDKARAALWGAAMAEVEQTKAAAKGPVEDAQIRQLIADMKATRDGALAKAVAGAAGAGAAGTAGALQVDPNMVVHTTEGSFIVPKGDAENMRQMLDSYDRLESAVRSGINDMTSRSTLDRVNPWSENVAQGGVDYGAAQATLGRLEQARGLPPSVARLAQEMLPNFGSRTTVLSRDLPKARRLLQLLQNNRQTMLENAGAMPVDIGTGPGTGKNADKLTYYARPRAPKPAAPPPAQRDYGFTPAGAAGQ